MSVLFMGLMTMVAAQLFDLSTFLAMIHRHGSAVESNPLVSGALSNDGLVTVVLAKIVLMVFVAALTVVLVRTDRPSQARIAAVVIGVSILAGLIGGGSNALVLGNL
jgi:uncharacterized membrane protein